jgi:PAS domain S-box-containing protein
MDQTPPNHLRVLHLEDDPMDTELVRDMLRDEGLPVELDRVDSMLQFRELLGHASHALILSDYTIPGVDPMEALQLARRVRPEVPFLFLSGTLGEDVAIETLKKGATDYVLKQHLSRLAPAVRRALHEASEQSLRRRAEKQLRLQGAALQATANAIVITDRAGIIQWVNPAFERLTGYPASEAVGQNPRILKSAQQENPAFFRLMWNTILTGRVWRGELVNRRKDGTCYTEEMTITPVKDAREGITHFIAVKQDVTARQQAAMSLQQARDQLKAYAESLEKTVAERTTRLTETVSELEHFSYSITHDMRAPLRAMQTFSTILEDECAPSLPPKGADYLRRIRVAAARMDQLIQDSLDYSKIVREDLPMAPVELAHLLRGMIETYPNLQPATADIIVEFNELKVLGNTSALTQCFSNLLDNSVKFVARGTRPRVRVWAEFVEDASAQKQGYAGELQGHEAPAEASAKTTAGTGSAVPQAKSESSSGAEHPARVRIWIEDNGIGIPNDARDKIFGMFQRVHRTEDFPGTGIGLAIVRKAAQRMGGRAGFESDAGKGSRFWLEFNAAS